DRERDVRAVAFHLTGVGVEPGGRKVAVDPLDIDLAATAGFALGQGGAAGVANGTRDHVRLARGRRRTCGVDGRRRLFGETDVVDPELGARDLEDHVRDALPDLGGGAVDFRRPVRKEPDAGGAVVVEALREADVLEADREAGAAANPLASCRVARTAGEAKRV